MILQSASRKEVKRIAIGTLCGDGILVAGLFLLSQFDIGTFDLPRILLSAAGGSLIAVLNFAIMCITVQSAVGMEDKKKMQDIWNQRKKKWPLVFWAFAWGCGSVKRKIRKA